MYIKKGKFGPRHAHRESSMWRVELCSHKPRNYQKLGERPGTDPSLEPPEGAWLYWHLDLGFLAPRTTRQYMTAILSHTVYGTWLTETPAQIPSPSWEGHITCSPVRTVGAYCHHIQLLQWLHFQWDIIKNNSFRTFTYECFVCSYSQIYAM